MAAHLDGTITPEGAFGYNLVVRFFTPGTDTEIHKSAAPTDPSTGDFDVYDAPVGTYDVGIKAQNSLSLLAASQVFTEGGTTVIDFGAIAGGDLNEDDYVSGGDSSIQAAHWLEWGGCYGYAGDWLLPPCPIPPPVGACYGYIIG